MRSIDLARALFVLSGAVAQVVMGALPFIQGWENTVADRSAEAEVLLTPASFAFSIWSVLFVGCGIYALIHLIRLTHPAMRATGWLAGAAFWLNTAWESWVPVFGIEIVSLGLIMASWMSCVAFMLIASADKDVRLFGRAARLPMYALGGWLNAAATVNLLIVMEVYGVPFFSSGEDPAALAVLAIGLIAAAAVILRTGSLSYALAVQWGLAGIADGLTYTPVDTLVDVAATYAAVVLVPLLLAIGWAGRAFRASSTAFRPR